MSTTIIAGRDLSMFPTNIVGNNSTLIKNADGSWLFQSTAADSSAYGYYQFPARQGETIELSVMACALAPTNADGSNAPMIAVRWGQADGTWKNSSINYVTSTVLGVYKVTLTVNDPVKDGDYIIVSFGHFSASMVAGVFLDAQVTVKNSFFPVKRTIIESMIQIEASQANVSPVINYLNQFTQMAPNSISWQDNSTLLVQDNRLKIQQLDRNSWTVDCRLCMSNSSNSDYFKLNVYHGMYDWNNGQFNLTFTDTSTGKFYDFLINETKKLVCNFEVTTF